MRGGFNGGSLGLAILFGGSFCCGGDIRGGRRHGPVQKAFRDMAKAQGFGWALVRSVEDTLGALADHDITTRVQALNPRRRACA